MFNKLLFVTVIAFAGPGSGAAIGQTPGASANVGRQLFISPMGEPFRGAARKDMVKAWFDGADINKDVALDLTEVRADAARFFKFLNSNNDNEIDPTELGVYENRIAPEVRVGYAAPQPVRAGENSGSIKPKAERERRGAAMHSFMPTPNPVASADTNFNRGVTPEEFARAARDRFVVLDANRDGQLRFDELPELPSRL